MQRIKSNADIGRKGTKLVSVADILYREPQIQFRGNISNDTVHVVSRSVQGKDVYVHHTLMTSSQIFNTFFCHATLPVLKFNNLSYFILNQDLSYSNHISYLILAKYVTITA